MYTNFEANRITIFEANRITKMYISGCSHCYVRNNFNIHKFDVFLQTSAVSNVSPKFTEWAFISFESWENLLFSDIKAQTVRILARLASFCTNFHCVIHSTLSMPNGRMKWPERVQVGSTNAGRERVRRVLIFFKWVIEGLYVRIRILYTERESILKC